MTSDPAATAPHGGASRADDAGDRSARRGTSRGRLSALAPRSAVTGGSMLAICALLLVGLLLPVPYVIEQPGPAIDVLGSYEGDEILTISGHERYPTSGALMMTTVSVDGGPGHPVTPAEVVAAWFDSSESILPRETVYPDRQTEQETALQNASDMTTSQQDAVAVALQQLDVPTTPNVMVAGVLDGGPAAKALKAGDVVLSVNGQTRATTEEYQQLTRSAPAGKDIAMRVRRDGAEKDVSVPTEQVDGTTRMGISLAQGYDTPVDVHLALKDVGGPSAGTMFSLAVYDELTPGALTGGQKIAGTGTMDGDGAVGEIGGIRQKMVGARKQGAGYFLAPAANCDQVVGHVPDGLSVVKVSTFADALHATQTIAATKSTSGLPTCQK